MYLFNFAYGSINYSVLFFKQNNNSKQKYNIL